MTIKKELTPNLIEIKTGNLTAKGTNQYSKVNFPLLTYWKKFFKKYGIDYTNYAILENVKLADAEKNYPFKTALLSCHKFLENSYTNIFLSTPQLYNFLANTNVKITVTELLNFIRKLNLYLSKDSGSSNILLKLYSKEIPRTIFMGLSLWRNCDPPRFLLFACDGIVAEYSPFTNIDSFNIVNKDNELNKNFLKLFLNLLFYMQCFPKNITNKPPNEVFDKLNLGNSKTISLSNEIQEYLHETKDISPHLRRGHFRLLSSEFYTKKHGQVIFVNPSFVKGHAKTIIE